jgi:hypothetical protein
VVHFVSIEVSRLLLSLSNFFERNFSTASISIFSSPFVLSRFGAILSNSSTKKILLTIRLISLRRNTIQLIDEDNRRSILLRVLKCSSEVRFCFSGHFTHHFRTVDQKEKGTSLVGDRFGDQGLTGTWGEIEVIEGVLKGFFGGL